MRTADGYRARYGGFFRDVLLQRRRRRRQLQPLANQDPLAERSQDEAEEWDDRTKEGNVAARSALRDVRPSAERRALRRALRRSVAHRWSCPVCLTVTYSEWRPTCKHCGAWRPSPWSFRWLQGKIARCIRGGGGACGMLKSLCLLQTAPTPHTPHDAGAT